MTDASYSIPVGVPQLDAHTVHPYLSLGTLGMWTFLISDAVTFATLLVSSSFLRAWSPNWPVPAKVFNLPVIGVMTGLLLASSIAMALALSALRQGNRARFTVSLLLTIVGGSVFLLLQAYEWSHLMSRGLTLTQNPWGARLFGSSFFVLTGFHGCHVIVGIVYLAVILMQGLKGRYYSVHLSVVASAGLYWYFVDVSWLFILLRVYIL